MVFQKDINIVENELLDSRDVKTVAVDQVKDVCRGADDNVSAVSELLRRRFACLLVGATHNLDPHVFTKSVE